LHAFYEALRKEKRIPANPAQDVPGMPLGAALPRAIPIDDQERICAQPDVRTPEGLRDRVLLELMRHGMRQNEFVRLLISGIEYDQSNDAVILTFRAKGRARTARMRQLPLRREAASLFALYLLRTYAPDRWPLWLAEIRKTDPKGDVTAWRFAGLRYLLTLVFPGIADEPVFRTDTDHELYQVWVNRMFAKYRAAAGVASTWGPHTFRHRFCTSLLEGNVDVRESLQLSGHADIRSLMRYTAVTRKRSVANIEVIGSAPITDGGEEVA
jgi:integrase/recombinase XerD